MCARLQLSLQGAENVKLGMTVLTINTSVGRYSIGALVLMVDLEGIEWCRKEKDKSGILKESASKKMLRPIIQQSTSIDIIRLKIPVRK